MNTRDKKGLEASAIGWRRISASTSRLRLMLWGAAVTLWSIVPRFAMAQEGDDAPSPPAPEGDAPPAEAAGGLLDKLPAADDIFWSLVVLAIAFFIARVTTATLDRIGARFATRRLLLKKVASLTRFMLYLGATVFIILGIIQPESSTLTALITASAVMIGFAFKDLAGSIIAGVIILIDSPFQVGDRVQFGDTYGEVTEIGLRVVQITTLDDNLVSIPNNKFLTEVVSSANAGALDMMVQMDFHIGMTENYLLAKKLAYEATVTSRFVFLDKPVVVHVNEVKTDTAFAMRIRTKFYIIDTRFESAIQTDITERLKVAFGEQDIKAPYHFEADPFEMDDDVVVRASHSIKKRDGLLRPVGEPKRTPNLPFLPNPYSQFVRPRLPLRSQDEGGHAPPEVAAVADTHAASEMHPRPVAKAAPLAPPSPIAPDKAQLLEMIESLRAMVLAESEAPVETGPGEPILDSTTPSLPQAQIPDTDVSAEPSTHEG